LVHNHYQIRQYFLYELVLNHKCNYLIFYKKKDYFYINYFFLRFDDSLNQSLYKVKQLESRLQMTEISNRALLEEVIRLQTELFNAVKSFLFINYSKNKYKYLFIDTAKSNSSSRRTFISSTN
jgi:hypothetical protein